MIDANLGIFTMMTAVKEHFNTNNVAQALIVAAITASATGYVSAKVLEREVSYMIQEIKRVDSDQKNLRDKVDQVSLRQASVIAQANTIHEMLNDRVNKLETRKKE